MSAIGFENPIIYGNAEFVTSIYVRAHTYISKGTPL